MDPFGLFTWWSLVSDGGGIFFFLNIFYFEKVKQKVKNLNLRINKHMTDFDMWFMEWYRRF